MQAMVDFSDGDRTVDRKSQWAQVDRRPMNGQEHSPSHLSTFIKTACTVNIKKLAPSVKKLHPSSSCTGFWIHVNCRFNHRCC